MKRLYDVVDLQVTVQRARCYHTHDNQISCYHNLLMVVSKSEMAKRKRLEVIKEVALRIRESALTISVVVRTRETKGLERINQDNTILSY